MRQILWFGCVFLIVAATIVSGLLHGRLTNRWGQPADWLQVASALAAVPEQLGPWQMVAAEELTETVAQTLECTGYVLRTYRHELSGETVNVAVLLGPPGPMTVHTPEICYSGRDYRFPEERRLAELEEPPGSEHAFWALRLHPRDPLRAKLDVYYAWSDGGAWMAPSDPRFSLANRPYLYKLQLAGEVVTAPDGEEESPCERFLTDVIPHLQSHLVSAAGASTR